MKKLLLIFLLLDSLGLRAQDVTFINMGYLLETINNVTPPPEVAVDMNGDFLDDIVRVRIDGIHIEYQQPDGSFSYVLHDIPMQNIPDWSICAGDLTGNGFNDLLFGGGSKVSFVYANDDGTSYTEQIDTNYIFSQRSNLVDIDNDGDLDAFVCHDVDQSHPYRNDGTGNMIEDQTLIETFDGPGNYSSIWTDYDNDGDIDLYISKCYETADPGDINRTNLLYQNNGDGTFKEVGEEAGVADNAQSWSTVFEDFDNDGDFDAFVVNHDFKNRFYRNNGDGTFTDIIDETGIDPYDLESWENSSVDFNNDGYMDIFSQMNSTLYYGNGDLTFTSSFVLFDPGAIGDFNNDGFMDVLRRNNLWINNGNDNNWLKINTIGLESNRNGIGARIEIYGSWGRQTKEVRAGQSFAPMSTLQTHFGIGQADSIEKVVVKWPSGVVTVVEDVAINTTVTIQEVGCTLPQSEIIANGDTKICPGDSIEITAPSGFRYEWSTGDSTQSIVVSDAELVSANLYDTLGCASLTNQIEVSFIEEVPSTIDIDGFHTFCEGDEVTLTASEGENHLWSNGVAGPILIADETGSYSVSIDAKCSDDPIQSDTIIITEVMIDDPIVLGVNIIQGEVAELTAQGENLKWYDVPVGGDTLATGNTYVTDALNTTTTYYVEASKKIEDRQEGGKPDFEGTGGFSGTALYNKFNAYEPFVLNTVLVNVPGLVQTGETTVLLVTENDDTLASKVFDLEVGDTVLQLDFDVPVGEDLSLRCKEGNLFRSIGDGVNYPYPIGDVGEITTSLFGNNYYYYFYDWQITAASFDCYSNRVPVTVEVTDAHEAFVQAGFHVFPNPVANDLLVKMESPAERIILSNIQGQVVFEKNTSGNGTEKLEIGHFAAGMYFIKIKSAGKFYHTKFVKE